MSRTVILILFLLTLTCASIMTRRCHVHRPIACKKLHFTCASVEEAKRFESSITTALKTYQVIHYDDRKMRSLVSEFGNEALAAFDCVKPFAYKADIFRLCALIKFGGLYLDANMEARSNNVNAHIDFNSEYIFVREDRAVHEEIPYMNRPFHEIALWQAFLYCKHANSHHMHYILRNIVRRVTTPNLREIRSFKQGSLVTLYFTGPIAVGEFGLQSFGIPDWASKPSYVQLLQFREKQIVNNRGIAVLGKSTARDLGASHYHNMFTKHGIAGLVFNTSHREVHPSVDPSFAIT